MGLFFGPLEKLFWSHGPLFWTPRPIFDDFSKTKKDAQRPYDQFGGSIAPRSLLCVRKRKFLFCPKTPGFPDAAAAASASAAAADGRTLRSQPDPSPNAPKDQIRRKGPCCDLHIWLWSSTTSKLLLKQRCFELIPNQPLSDTPESV